MFFHKQTKEVEQVEKFVRSLSITIPAKYEDEIYKLYPTDIYYIVLFILICIIGNFINVLMEEGLFRGLFPRMLNSRRFWKVTDICSLLFGFWHIVGPVRNYIDGQSSFQGMIANAIMLIVSSTLVGLKLAMITYMEGNLYMGMADHFVNNTIVNLLHIESSTGADEMMFLRITVAQTISFFIVLFIFLERKNHGKKGIINKTISE